MHRNGFAPLATEPQDLDHPPSSWTGAVMQYLEQSAGLDDKQLQQQLLHQFGQQFAAELHLLHDRASSLTQHMVEWLKDRLPAELQGSYGGESDSSV